MGGAVSSGQNNEELVDNLCQEDYLRTPAVERVFRMIDRADYMVFREEEERLEAYEDHAWRRGTLHLSAPCIYTRALEALKLGRGVSFLNVGSGTGYFSTMAGLMIGPYGINHGIEIYQENVEYAYEKLQEFKETSKWYDPVEFCDPMFLVGNGLLLSPGNILYDRIYCGAACPPEHAQLMKNMLKEGGILVMPHDNQLEAIHRVSLTEWATDVILPSVSFAPLILPSAESVKDMQALEIPVEPHSLKQLCRLAVLGYIHRERYSDIPRLPLPPHLKDYVSHYHDWPPTPPPIRTQCPIIRSKEEGSGDDDNGRKRRRGDSTHNSRAPPQMAHAVSINGRRMLLCNFNGIIFQVPIDSDDSDNEEGGGASGRGSDEAGSGQVSDNELSGDDPVIGKGDEPMQESPDEDLYGDEDLAESVDQSDEGSNCEFEDTAESLEQSAHSQMEDDF